MKPNATIPSQPPGREARASRPSRHPIPASKPVSGARPSSARPGRPTLYDDSLVEALCSLIRQRGLSPSAAAERLGLSPASISRWKSSHPELELDLRQAREQFRAAKLQLLLDARRSDGSPDWRAAAWLLERIFPEDYARNRRPRPEPEEPEAGDPVPSVPSVLCVPSVPGKAVPRDGHRVSPPASGLQNLQNPAAEPPVTDASPSPESIAASIEAAPGAPEQPTSPAPQPRLSRRQRRKLDHALRRQATRDRSNGASVPVD